MEMEIFFREKFAEFLQQNNQQIISKDEVTNLRRHVKEKEDQLKNSQGAFKQLQKNYQEETNKVKILRKKVARGKTQLADEYVCKLKYEELKSTVKDVKKQLQTANETISHEKAMKLKVDQEVKELQKKMQFIEERERSLIAVKKDLLINHRRLEKQLNEANEVSLNQLKLNKKLADEKEDLNKQFISDSTKTRREIVALKEEIERLTMEQFKFLAFVREIANASSFQGYRSDDAYTVCGQLDSISNHVKTTFEKLRCDLNKLVNRDTEKENQGSVPQENLGTESNTSMSTSASRSPSPCPSDRIPSIVVELRSPDSSSNRVPQQNLNSERSQLQPLVSSTNRKGSGKAKSSVSRPYKKRRKYRKGIKRLQREILKKKKHAMWMSKRGNGSVEGRWWCVCGKLFKRRASLIKHIQYYSLEWKFQCEKCPEIFRFLARLKAHLTNDHGISNPLREFEVGCSICGEMFPNRRALGRHRFFICKSESGNETPHRSSYRRIILTTPVHTPNYDTPVSGIVEVNSESESDQDGNSARTSTSIVSVHKTTSNHAEWKDALGQSHTAVVTILTDTESDTSSSDRE